MVGTIYRSQSQTVYKQVFLNKFQKLFFYDTGKWYKNAILSKFFDIIKYVKPDFLAKEEKIHAVKL